MDTLNIKVRDSYIELSATDLHMGTDNKVQFIVKQNYSINEDADTLEVYKQGAVLTNVDNVVDFGLHINGDQAIRTVYDALRAYNNRKYKEDKYIVVEYSGMFNYKHRGLSSTSVTGRSDVLTDLVVSKDGKVYYKDIPLPNIYDDRSICFSNVLQVEGNLMEQSSQAINAFFTSNFNSDLSTVTRTHHDLDRINRFIPSRAEELGVSESDLNRTIERIEVDYSEMRAQRYLLLASLLGLDYTYFFVY